MKCESVREMTIPDSGKEIYFSSALSGMGPGTQQATFGRRSDHKGIGIGSAGRKRFRLTLIFEVMVIEYNPEDLIKKDKASRDVY